MSVIMREEYLKKRKIAWEHWSNTPWGSSQEQEMFVAGFNAAHSFSEMYVRI